MSWKALHGIARKQDLLFLTFFVDYVVLAKPVEFIGGQQSVFDDNAEFGVFHGRALLCQDNRRMEGTELLRKRRRRFFLRWVLTEKMSLCLSRNEMRLHRVRDSDRLAIAAITPFQWFQSALLRCPTTSITRFLIPFHYTRHPF